MGDWTLFSNYGHVLICLSSNNESRLRDVAKDVGITERAVQKIVRDLQDAGYITIRKHGRRNRYRINSRKGLRHALESHCTVGKLVALMKQTDAKKSKDSVLNVQQPSEPLPEVIPSRSDPLFTTAVEPEPEFPPWQIESPGYQAGDLAGDQAGDQARNLANEYFGEPDADEPSRAPAESDVGNAEESDNGDLPGTRQQGSLF